MRIKTVTAHAFGPLREETLDFADGMTVIIGDNESAKSSWHAAIYAALCGRRRGRGKPRDDERRFIDLHKPWHGDDWLVSAEVLLDDGRRIEFRQDLAGKVDCHAKDLVIGTDVSGEVVNDGAPDGSRWLGLDRSSFRTTACVEQAQVLQVLDGAEGLQQQLQRAAATAGADATAAAALRLIDDFEREHVGTDRLNSTKPLRRVMDLVRDDEARLEAAQRAHQEYVCLAGKADCLRSEADSADAVIRTYEAAAAAYEAAGLREQAERAAELHTALGDATPAPAAADDALAYQVTEALTYWRSQPQERSLAGPTAAQLQALLGGLPPMPDGDLEVHGSVMQARDQLRSAEDRLQPHETQRPAVPDAVITAADATDHELALLALILETPIPVVDPALEATEEAARREADAVGGRLRAAGILLAAAAAAMVASGRLVVGVVAIAVAVVLAVLGVARRRAGPRGVITWHAAVAAKLTAARQQASETIRKRNEAVFRCGTLGLDADPKPIREVITARARAASYSQDLSRWQSHRTELQEQVASAETALLRALVARGRRAASLAPDDLSGAVEEYREECTRQAELAQQAKRRPDLTKQLDARQEQERRAEEDREKRAQAARLVTEAGVACGLAVVEPEITVTDLEKWLVQRIEQMNQLDRSRQQSAELEALLKGRSLDELADEEAAAALKAENLSSAADQILLADVDQASAAERLPALRDNARDAGNRAADASGELRQLAASVPSVAEAEEALDGGRAERDRVRQLQQTLTLTRRFLEDAQDRVHRDVAPVLAAMLREWLPGITAGRYTDVLVNPSTLRVEVCGHSRAWRPADRLSHGTAEQVYLLLRIALADHLTKGHDTCPLILDDVTVHADAARTREILTLLLKIAEHRQVILFSQEEQVADWARERLPAPGHALRTLSPVPAN
jgi:hypothetical protein